jgi:8-oxo-dGTP pyrophosphatase MutT (NUDIX family)
MIYHHYMTNTNANKLIPAATVLIVRNGQSGLEVFMVVRNHQIDFASGALVFPGGKVDKSDYDKKLVQFLSNSNVNDKDDLPYRIAAIRESFEEANVLFAKEKGESENISPDKLLKLSEWRDRFNNKHASMYDFANSKKIFFSTNDLIPFAHWVTPKMMPKRFDTKFYIAKAPDGQEGKHDGFESVDSIWIKPQDALNDCFSGKKTIIFPTRLNLEKLNQSKTVEEAISSARKSKVTIVIPTIEKDINGSFLTIPKDAGYGEIREVLSEASTPGALAPSLKK